MAISTSGIVGVGGSVFVILLLLFLVFILFLVVRFAVDKSNLRNEINEMKSNLNEIRRLLDKKEK